MSKGPNAAVVMQLSLRYVTASLMYLIIGGSLLLTTFAHVFEVEMTAFYFMQLYGFVAMMIFGLSYLFVRGIKGGPSRRSLTPSYIV